MQEHLSVPEALHPNLPTPRTAPPAAVSMHRPLSPELLRNLQRTVGNRATAVAIQRHQIETPPGELDQLEDVVQRLTAPELKDATAKVDTAISAAAGVKKTHNPVLYNTGKALKKGDVKRNVANEDSPSKKAWVQGQSTTVNLGGKWVLDHPTREIQGALAHEVAHVLAGPGLDLYQDEFNAYWAEVSAMATDRSAEKMREKLPIIQGLIKQYGWWKPAAAAKKEQWEAVAAPAGFNLSNSWKQKNLLNLMDKPMSVPEVVTVIKSMNQIDRAEARAAKRADGTYYLPWANYPDPGKTTIWRALGGTGQAP